MKPRVCEEAVRFRLSLVHATSSLSPSLTRLTCHLALPCPLFSSLFPSLSSVLSLDIGLDPGCEGGGGDADPVDVGVLEAGRLLVQELGYLERTAVYDIGTDKPQDPYSAAEHQKEDAR